jgi:cytoskeletal protein CcmA (bactofilin family)
MSCEPGSRIDGTLVIISQSSLEEQTMGHPFDKGDKKKVSVLGPTLRFKGDLSASEDLLIQGHVEGSITHTSRLTIGREGVLNASVAADVIAVEGTVNGDLVARTSVVVAETSEVNGNIFSPSVSLREGAKFTGKIDMSGRNVPQAAEPVEADNDDDAADESDEIAAHAGLEDNQQAAGAA